MLLLLEFLQTVLGMVLSPLLSKTLSPLPLQQEHLLAKLLNCKVPDCSIRLTSCFKLLPNVCVTSVIFFFFLVQSWGIYCRERFINYEDFFLFSRGTERCRLKDFSSKISVIYFSMSTSLYMFHSPLRNMYGTINLRIYFKCCQYNLSIYKIINPQLQKLRSSLKLLGNRLYFCYYKFNHYYH